MASWMVHLRIADRLLEKVVNVSAEHFIMGNIAPDSGEPNEDWSNYTPDKAASHYEECGADGKKVIRTDRFIAEYFTKEMQDGYTKEQYSFYLGYLTHLLTDILWKRNVYEKSVAAYRDRPAEELNTFVWEKLKRDWYDLDFLYLQKHPDFRAFQIYRGLVGFENRYMDMFSRQAFDNRRIYITDFYLADRDNVEREYQYLTPKRVDAFVEECCAWIEEQQKDAFIKE
ncbi:MAG: zinc dependent phospholipase C family protein [bacterium]|nr:zinc dependent phospholipase C family protein [bacterium]